MTLARSLDAPASLLFSPCGTLDPIIEEFTKVDLTRAVTMGCFSYECVVLYNGFDLVYGRQTLYAEAFDRMLCYSYFFASVSVLRRRSDHKLPAPSRNH
ncbi:uncharacterized protein MEPE_00859 [Melanopsichium pennsylvanicum]|uniref:Uncharacterized protein n=1 Tax=Melanopsichium pennsylvanicum TaxID=63383 RepID=A0AAJ5C342_9BASI|nr:uncharacterized protein MEPE_00859 [Melanopsichium pennsylvanicum]